MINLCKNVRKNEIEDEGGIILVKWSDGVGRNGKIIDVDKLMKNIYENKKVDIFGNVFKLSKKSVKMVKNEGK